MLPSATFVLLDKAGVHMHVCLSSILAPGYMPFFRPCLSFSIPAAVLRCCLLVSIFIEVLLTHALALSTR